jgi:nitrogenase subunit NifH
MSLITKDCVEYCDDRAICAAEKNKMVYVLNNISKSIIQKVNIDKISITGMKCDYLFNVKNKKAFFIELKGNKTNDAVGQLLNTIHNLKSELGNIPFAARIVGAKIAPDIKQAKPYRMLSKLTKGDIVPRTNRYEETC